MVGRGPGRGNHPPGLGFHLLVGVLLVVSACGDDSSTTPGGLPGESSRGVEVVEILSATAADGRVTDTGVELASAREVDRLVRGVGGALARQVRDVVARTEVPTGRRLVGQVVAIGCGRPDGVRVLPARGAVTLTPTYAVKPPPECFAPVTSIALVLLDER